MATVKEVANKYKVPASAITVLLALVGWFQSMTNNKHAEAMMQMQITHERDSLRMNRNEIAFSDLQDSVSCMGKKNKKCN